MIHARRRCLGRGAAFALAGCQALLPLGPAAQAATLTIGVPPFLSPVAILEAVRPLREHLARQLARPVEVFSARDFRALFDGTRRGEYDVVLLPGHVAAVAIHDWRYVPLASVLETTQLLVMTPAGSPLRAAADLRGRRIGVLDPVSLTAVAGRLWLRSHQLEAGRDVTLVTQPAINSGVVALERGEIDALMMTSFQVAVLKGAPDRTLRRLAEGPALPAPVFLAHARLAASDVARLKQALHAFTPDLQHAPGAFNAPLHEVTPQTLRRIDELLEPTRELLR